MLKLTDSAEKKLKELLGQREGPPKGIRIRAVGAVCSGPQYQMSFENSPGPLDEIFESAGFQLIIDSSSWQQLDSTTLDYVEMEGRAGFKFMSNTVHHCSGCGGACK
jgi:iron-sulfur cluster assembly accessory protein